MTEQQETPDQSSNLAPLTRAETEGIALTIEQLETDRRPQFVLGRIFAIWEARKIRAIQSSERWPGPILKRDPIGWFNRLVAKGQAHEKALSKDGSRSLYEMDIIRLTSFFRFDDVPQRFRDTDLMTFSGGYYAQRALVVHRGREIREAAEAKSQSRA
jgi:hypothetical protein